MLLYFVKMQVIGFNFEKISAERKEQEKKPEEKIEINSNISVKDITQEKIGIVKDKPVLKITFEFLVNYKPNVADIILRGNILTLVEKDEAKSITKKWKDKKISDDVRIPLFNIILTRCNLKALDLEEQLNLPTHIPLPRIKPQQQGNKSYTG